MAHVEKFTRAGCAQLFAHYERREGRKYGNQEIDRDKSYLNFNLAPCRNLSQNDYLQKRLNEVRVLNRKDVKVMCDWVVTIPKELKGERPDYQEVFFRHAYDFLEEKYGKENVISAYVHMDETTPHMHFSFIPVTRDKKRGDLKVSAKEVLTRKELQGFHSDLQLRMRERMGRDLSILNDATVNGNKTVAELKMAEKIRERELEIESAIQEKRGQLKSLTPNIKESKLEQLTGYRLVNGQEYKRLKASAKAYKRNEERIFESKEILLAKVKEAQEKTRKEVQQEQELKIGSLNYRLEEAKVKIERLEHQLEASKADQKELVDLCRFFDYLKQKHPEVFRVVLELFERFKELCRSRERKEPYRGTGTRYKRSDDLER